MKNVEVSVLMPVYNAEKYLAKAIESILEQTFKDFEFIITNDGSTDGSLDIMRKYAAVDDRIRVIDRENRGLIYTRNEGLNASTGQFIALMDADDISFPNRFQKQLDFLNTHQKHVAIGGQAILIDADGDILAPFNVRETHNEIDGAHLDSHGGAIVNPSSMIRKSSILQVNGYHDAFKCAEDLDMWLRLGEVGSLANLPDTLIYYRQHLESIGYARRKEQFESAIAAVKAACNRRSIKLPEEILPNEANFNPSTTAEVYIKWGWWAHGVENHKTAMKYALKTLKIAPFSIEAWKLLACVLRGR